MYFSILEGPEVAEAEVVINPCADDTWTSFTVNSTALNVGEERELQIPTTLTNSASSCADNTATI